MFATHARNLLILRTLCNSRGIATKKVAVILSGSGVFDGSEIHEASSTLIHLNRLKYEPQCYAPDMLQLHTINHLKGEESCDERRNVLVESARIARGKITPLSELNVNNIAGAFFPGGFGAAKNLSNFATEGTSLKIQPDVAKVITDLHAAKKPIAFMCISPILAARVLPGVSITLGQQSGEKWPHCGAVEAAKTLGAKIELCNVDQVCVDKMNRVLSTPAFMYDGDFYEIFSGIGKLVENFDMAIKTC